MTCDIVNVTDNTFNCMFDGYLDVTGELQLGMLLSVMVAAPLYAKYEDPVVPAVALTLIGGAMFPALPGFLRGVAWVVVFAGLTMGMFTVIYRTMIQ